MSERLSVKVTKTAPKMIEIGRRGETGVLYVDFDVSALVAAYGDGTAVVLHKRPHDSDPYPVTVTRSGNIVSWEVADADTEHKGYGEAELFWYVGAALAKSVVYKTLVLRDIGESITDPPDLYETWVETLTGLGAETLANAQAAEAAQSAAETAQAAAEAAQTAAETAQGNAEAAQQAAEAAQTASESAQASAEAADRDAQQRASSAATSATNAASSASGAAESASAAAQSAADAAYSAAAAASSAQDADASADRAEQCAATHGYMWVYIDENGDLIYQSTTNVEVDFALENGDLYMEVA